MKICEYRFAQGIAAGKSPRLYGERKAVPEGRGVPLVLAPTTSGTGSEVSINEDVGLPMNLQELGGINESDIEDMAELMIKNWPRPMNPRPMNLEGSVEFWQDMWDGIY